MNRSLATTLAATLVLATAAPVAAHTMVRSTSIADGATLPASPPNVTVTFDHPAAVGNVRLTTATGETVPLTWTPPRGLNAGFTVPLPRLEPDRYRLSWRVIAQDGHVMSGALNFTIAPPRPGAPAVKRP